MPPRTIKQHLTCSFEITSGSFLIGRRRILVIPRNQLVDLRLKKFFKKFKADIRISLRNTRDQSRKWRMIHSQDNFYFTCSKILVAFLFYMDLSL